MGFPTTGSTGTGCECCDAACTIESDDFNRSDSTSIGADWNEVLAEWEIDTNQLRGSAARALVIHNTLHPDGDAGKSRVKATLTPDYTAAATCKGRIVVSYVDSDNYMFCEAIFVEDSCVTIRLGSRIAASETWLTDALSVAPGADDAITLYVCWQPPTGSGSDYVEGTLSANVSGASLSCLSAEDAGVSGDQVGLEVTAGEVLFDNFLWEYHFDASNPTCPQCSCAGVCTIFADNFTGRSVLGCWTQVSGTASVGSGVLTHSGDTLVVANAIPQTDEDAIKVSATIRSDSTTATIRIIVGYTDASNYLFAEIALASSVVTARLGRRTSGSDTYLTSAETIENVTSFVTAQNIELCYRPGNNRSAASDSQVRSPTVAWDIVNSDGDSWTDVGNVYDSDDTYATFVFDKAELSPRLRVGNFGFSIPPGSTIDGIELGGELGYEVDQGTCIDKDVFYFYADPSAGDYVSGDMAFEAALPDYGSPDGTLTWGGAATLSGGTPEWYEINSDNFFFSLLFEATTAPTSNAPLRIDHLVAQVYYTEPAREPGRLQLKFGGECITATGITQDTGSQVGFKFPSGTWEVDEFHLQYMLSGDHPTCPECCEAETAACGCCSPASTQYAVEISGVTYVVDLVYYSSSGDFCVFIYRENTTCDGTPGEMVITLMLYTPSGDGILANCMVLNIGFVYGSSSVGASYSSGDCDEVAANTLTQFFDSTDGSECGIVIPGSVTVEQL